MQPHLKKFAPVVLFAVLGLGLSCWIEVLHTRLTSDINYTSFCSVNERVDCDLVLTSRYADFAGQPVSRWAIAFYLGVLGGSVALAYADRAKARENIARGLLTASGLGFLFSVYMAVVAFFVLKTICLMCSGLYLISIGLLVSSWRLRNDLRVVGARQREASGKSDRSILTAGGVAAGLLVVAVAYEVMTPSTQATTAEQIRLQRPEFYKWFFEQPKVSITSDYGSVRGKADAPVTIVEFSDFQCGHCAKLHESLEQVLRRQGGNVRVLFRHFPLDSSCNSKLNQRFHPDACLAAVAAECAGEQGRFWEYHSILFEHQSELGREFLNRYATDLGLDLAKFSACLIGDAALQRVHRDVEEGKNVEVESTPTIFINGRRIKGALEADRLADAIVLAATK